MEKPAEMIDEKTKAALNEIGENLSKILLDFYGKIVFNFQNSKYVNSNVEQSIKPSNLKKGADNESWKCIRTKK